MSVITPPVALSPSKLGTVLEVFESNFRRYDEIGASISIWWQGNELLCHASGWCEKEQLRPWTERTLIPVYSATKVPSAATLLLALANHGMDESTPLREVWKNFPVAEANFSHLLSHQCGLAILDQDADEALERTERRAVEHNGAVLGPIGADVIRVEPLGQDEIDL